MYWKDAIRLACFVFERQQTFHAISACFLVLVLSNWRLQVLQQLL